MNDAAGATETVFDPYDTQERDNLALDQKIALDNRRMPDHLIRLSNVFQFDFSRIWKTCGVLSSNKELFSMIEETIDYISMSEIDNIQKETAYNLLRMELEAIHYAAASRSSVVAL